MALNQASENSIMAQPASKGAAPDGTGVVQLDPWLEPFTEALKHRFAKTQKWIKTIDETEGGLDKFSRGYEKMGFTFGPNGDITYR
ncbi:alpha-1,4-glucan branching enzyme [Exophiala xenobiotica]|nr:alpha-1,4-glucan branching enzyme [Exophiala xenobiotica]